MTHMFFWFGSSLHVIDPIDLRIKVSSTVNEAFQHPLWSHDGHSASLAGGLDVVFRWRSNEDVVECVGGGEEAIDGLASGRSDDGDQIVRGDSMM